MGSGPSFLEVALAKQPAYTLYDATRPDVVPGYMSCVNPDLVAIKPGVNYLSTPTPGAIKLSEAYQYSQTQAGMAQQAVSNYHETWAAVGTPALLSFGGLAGVAMNGLVAVVGGVQIYDNPKDFDLPPINCTSVN